MFKKVLFLSIAVLVIYSRVVSGQNYHVENFITGGTDNLYSEKGMVKDKDSNLYIVCLFNGRFSIGSSQVTSSAMNGIYLAKLNSNLKLQWLHKIADHSDHINGVLCNPSIAIDTSGNLIIGLDFGDSLSTFGQTFHSSTTQGSAFMKLDSAGHKIWLFQVPGNIIGGTGITVDNQNNILVTGTFNNDIFTSKYTPGGTLIWNRTAGGRNQPDYGYSVKTDQQNNVYVSGSLSPSNSVYFDTIHVAINPSYFIASCLAKYNSSGDIQWVRYVYTRNFAEIVAITSVSCSANGKIYIGGSYTSSYLNFSIGSPVGYNANGGSNGAAASFLACFDSLGNRVWAKKMHNNYGADVAVDAIALDDSSNVWFLSDFNGQLALGADTFISRGHTDLLLSKADTAGNVNWTMQIGGAGFDECHQMLYDKNSIYLFGSTTSSPLYFDQSPYTTGYSTSMYLAKLTDVVSSIPEISSKDNLLVYPNPNTGIFTIQLPVDNTFESLQLTDVLGRVVYQQKLHTQERVLNIKASEVVAGVYFLQLNSATNQLSKKIIITNN